LSQSRRENRKAQIDFAGTKDFGEKIKANENAANLIHPTVAIAILIIANLAQSLDHLLD